MHLSIIYQEQNSKALLYVTCNKITISSTESRAFTTDFTLSTGITVDHSVYQRKYQYILTPRNVHSYLHFEHRVYLNGACKVHIVFC